MNLGMPMEFATASTTQTRAYVYAAVTLIQATHDKKQAGNLLNCHQPLASLLEQPDAKRVLQLKLGKSVVDTLVDLLRFHRDVLLLFEKQFTASAEKLVSIKYPQDVGQPLSHVCGLKDFLAHKVDEVLFNDFLLSLTLKYML